MEEFLQDKIFQFYYKKIYGKKSNYLSFKTFTDKDKVSFLINLYLFISDNSNNSYKNDFKSINENSNFYKDNYNNIMSEYTRILNKYSNEFYSKNVINDNNNKNILNKSNNNNELIKKEEKKINNKFNINLDNENNYDEKNKQEKNKVIINNGKNENNLRKANNQELKSGEDKFIDNKEDTLNKIKIINQTRQNNIENENYNVEYEQDKTENINNKNNLENSSRSYDLQNINQSLKQTNINNNKFEINMNLNNKQTLFKSGNLTSRNSTKTPNLKITMKDIDLTDKTLTERSLAQLEEFTNDNIVEKLIKCPQNKYISLNCSEANKIALVLINLMESKNDLESEIEEERKKNEIIIEKLKLDFDKEKHNIKITCNKKETNIKKVLDELQKEINNEKLSLKEEEKGCNLWDHITIENQRTKEIKESIMKKLESIKK